MTAGNSWAQLEAAAENRRGDHRHGGIVALALLSLLLGAAMLGVLGGAKSPWRMVEASRGTLAVKTPQTLRSGLFFEQNIRIDARSPVSDTVVAISPALWRDITVNTIIPAASEEEFSDGRYRLHFGPLAAGERFELKIDGQINPPLTLGTRGSIGWADGDQPIAEIPIAITVLP